MYKVVLWGLGAEYDNAYNQICFEQYKENIVILAAIDPEVSFSKIDGVKIADKKSLSEINYDYIVAFARDYNATKREIISFGGIADNILDGRIFLIPGFDFIKYVKIKESRVSIVADNCWGAYTYNTLAMKFLSPFILCFVSSTDHANELIASDEYLLLLESLDKFLQSPVEMVRDMPENAYWCWPKGKLVAGNHEIHLNFNHSKSFEEAKASWDRRLRRFNWDNIFVKMTIYNEEQAERFDRLPFRNKVGFYHKDSPYESIIHMCEWNDILIRQYGKYAYSFDTYLMRSADTSNYNSKPYNVFDMLLGEKDFLRKK